MPVYLQDPEIDKRELERERLSKKKGEKLKNQMLNEELKQEHPTSAQEEAKTRRFFKIQAGGRGTVSTIKSTLKAAEDATEYESRMRTQEVLRVDPDSELKSMLMKVLTLPVATDPVKQKHLENKLNGSKIINEYVHDNFVMRVAGFLSPDLRAGATYLFYLAEANADVNTARRIQGEMLQNQMRAQQNAQNVPLQT